MSKTKGFGELIQVGSQQESEILAAINQNKTAVLAATIPVATPETPPNPPPEPAPTLSMQEVEGLIAQSVQNAIAPLEQQLTESREKVDKINADLQVAVDARTKLEDLFKIRGNPNPTVPMVNTQTATGDKVDGALAECLAIYDKASAYEVATNSGESSVIVRDIRDLDRYVRNHYQATLQSLEDAFKRAGLLKGNSDRRVDLQATTTRVDVPEGFLATLSSFMRMEHLPNLIFHQFPVMEFDFAKGEGDTMKVPRSPDPTNMADYTLSGAGVYSDINSNTDPITSSSVDAKLEEYGRGKQGTTINPVGMPTFVTAYSMLQLLAILNKRLTWDYLKFEDFAIRRNYALTTRVVYNANDRVTTTATDLQTGGNGTVTESYLHFLFAYMRNLRIPALPNGRYILVLNSLGAAQLLDSLSTKFQYPSEAAIADVTNILKGVTSYDTGKKITGYLGAFCGFEVFETNVFGGGIAGTEGVTQTTFGAGVASQPARSSYAFGVEAVGRGVGMPFEIREDEVTNFGRRQRFIWLSHEVFCPLDVDSAMVLATAPNQQTRVLELRTTDRAF
jgi:hypothetical protein